MHIKLWNHFYKSIRKKDDFKIRVLSDHIINKIAAGEVIENPSSVVKELVENSLDAGATSICIEIQGGGRQLIRVSDNGCGMSQDDALLCLERHATSKLRDVEDIHSILTMGFRGEAIPSIASISKFNLLTCPAQEGAKNSIGTMVIVDGGKLVSCTPAVRSQGTTIEIKSLFFNVPVRKKFLKSPTFDANEILKTLTLMALSSPKIRFELINDGKKVLLAPPAEGNSFSEKMRCRLENVLGKDFTENTTFIEERKGDFIVEGMVGLPSYTRHNRTGQFLFINKRAVVSPLIAFAIKEGYGTAIPSGRFPVFVVHLTLPGDLVDVNVHPQKREVRLRQEQLIKEMVVKAVRGSLTQNSPVFPDSFLQQKEQPFSPVFKEAFETSDKTLFQDIPASWVFQQKIPSSITHEWPEIPLTSTREVEKKDIQQKNLSFENSLLYQPLVEASHFSLPFFQLKESPPQVLATLPSYILLDGSVGHSFFKKNGLGDKGGLILVDQRSAHARILFEKLSTAPTNPIVQQTLLVPQKIELAPYESEVLRTCLSTLNTIGIQIKEAQNQIFSVWAIPHFLNTGDLQTLIKDMIRDLLSAQIEQVDEQFVMREQTKRIASSIARKIVPIGKKLSLIEAQSLVDQLICCQQPHICPFGKSVLAQIGSEELAKLF